MDEPDKNINPVGAKVEGVKRRWLLKTEPGDYSFSELLKDGSTVWDGVKAPAALKNMRAMQPGDELLIYHTGKEKMVVGTGRVTRGAYPDPDQGNPRLIVVDIEAEKALNKPVSLAQIKTSGLFPHWELIRQPRLSVLPVGNAAWQKIIEWGS